MNFVYRCLILSGASLGFLLGNLPAQAGVCADGIHVAGASCTVSCGTKLFFGEWDCWLGCQLGLVELQEWAECLNKQAPPPPPPPSKAGDACNDSAGGILGASCYSGAKLGVWACGGVCRVPDEGSACASVAGGVQGDQCYYQDPDTQESKLGNWNCHSCEAPRLPPAKSGDACNNDLGGVLGDACFAGDRLGVWTCGGCRVPRNGAACQSIEGGVQGDHCAYFNPETLDWSDGTWNCHSCVPRVTPSPQSFGALRPGYGARNLGCQGDDCNN